LKKLARLSQNHEDPPVPEGAPAWCCRRVDS
jgi:hypothetical protein